MKIDHWRRWSVLWASSPWLLFSCGRTQLNPPLEEPEQPTCALPTVDCGIGACVDVAHDPRHCGACGNACAEGSFCGDGMCVKHCVGDACPCTGASCELACQEGQLACSDASGQRVCIDPLTDVNHCGRCRAVCAAGSRCEAGRCCSGELCCPAPFSACRQADDALACIDTSRSNRHCGSCDVECAEGTTCVAGVCEPCSEVRFFLPVAEEVGVLAPLTPVRPLVEDVDGDGHLDVVTPSAGGSSLTLTRGDGRGAFAPPERLETLVSPRAVVAGDFDGDGDVDLATIGSGGVMVHSRLQDGSWSRSRLRHDGDIGATTFVALDVADVTGDARPELLYVAQTSAGSGVYLLQNQAGSFQPTLLHSSSQQFNRVQVGDFDTDGSLDVAVWAKTGDVLWGEGGASFLADEGVLDPKHNLQTPLALSDLNGDGLADMLTAEAYGQGTLLYGYYFRTHLAESDGSFRELPRGDAATWSQAPLVALADFNADGAVDLFSREQEVSVVDTFVGAGDGSFERSAASAVAADKNGFTTGDFDEDGQLDLVALHHGAQAFTLHAGSADGAFESPLLKLPDQTYLRDAEVYRYADRALPSIVVVGGLDEGRLRVLELDGTLDVAQRQEVAIYRPLSLTLSDVDGDGQPDAIVPAERALYWLRYLGDGQFASTPQSLGDLRSVAQAVSADLAGDGEPKVVALSAGISSYVVHVLSNLASGWNDTSFEVGVGARFAIGNVDFDDGPELVVAGGGKLQVFRVDSAGAALERASANIAWNYPTIELADIGGDGELEIIVGGDDGGGRGYAVYDVVLPGLSELAMEPQPLLSSFVGISLARSRIIDIDGDGLADFLESKGDGMSVMWRGQGDGHFERDEVYRLPGGRELVGLHDFDRDGLDDMLLKGSSEYAGSLLLVRGAIQCE